MECFNCKKMISIDHNVLYCPFCGAKLEDKKENFNDLGSLLVFIVNKYGEEILNSPYKMYAYIMDCKDSINSKDIKLLKIAIDTGVMERVYNAKKMNYDNDRIINTLCYV